MHTNTLHGVTVAEGVSAKALAVGFYNSLTMLSAELLARSYGGGVLKLEPTEAEALLIPPLYDYESRIFVDAVRSQLHNITFPHYWKVIEDLHDCAVSACDPLDTRNLLPYTTTFLFSVPRIAYRASINQCCGERCSPQDLAANSPSDIGVLVFNYRCCSAALLEVLRS
jgi:hypothetical protein